MILWVAAALGVFVGLVSVLGMVGIAWMAATGLLRQILRLDARLDKPAAR